MVTRCRRQIKHHWQQWSRQFHRNVKHSTQSINPSKTFLSDYTGFFSYTALAQDRLDSTQRVRAAVRDSSLSIIAGDVEQRRLTRLRSASRMSWNDLEAAHCSRPIMPLSCRLWLLSWLWARSEGSSRTTAASASVHRLKLPQIRTPALCHRNWSMARC